MNPSFIKLILGKVTIVFILLTSFCFENKRACAQNTIKETSNISNEFNLGNDFPWLVPYVQFLYHIKKGNNNWRIGERFAINLLPPFYFIDMPIQNGWNYPLITPSYVIKSSGIISFIHVDLISANKIPLYAEIEYGLRIGMGLWDEQCIDATPQDTIDNCFQDETGYEPMGIFGIFSGIMLGPERFKIGTRIVFAYTPNSNISNEFPLSLYLTPITFRYTFAKKSK